MNKRKGVKTAAVIDLGSNMLRMRVSQLIKGEPCELERLEYPLSLGHEVFTTGKISFESVRELSAVLRGFSEKMTEYGVTQYRVAATTALRDAKNRAYVIDQLKIQNDMTVEVLEDSQEKTLIYSEVLNFLARAEVKTESALISYIGAGTIGLAVHDGSAIVFSQNIPIGALKLHDVLGRLQEETDDFYTVVVEYLDAIVGHVTVPLSSGGAGISSLILTGGEIHTIANICGVACVNGYYEFRAQQIKNLFREIRGLSQEKISERYGLSEEQAELLYSALAIYVRLIKFTKAENLLSPRLELCDALMRQLLLPKSREEYEEQVRRNAIACAQAIACTYRCSRAHSECTRAAACKIFDKMKPAHGLSHRMRLLLELASILHDCGHYVNSKRHLASTFDLIKNIDVYGMTDREMLFIASISRYNEYGVPSELDAPELDQMNEADLLVISKLAAMFRLANSLDKSQKQKLSNLKVKLEADRLLIVGQSNQNSYLEKWAFAQTAPLFKEVFGIPPELSVKTFVTPL